MTRSTRPRPAPAPAFSVAHARADHWGLAAKACQEGVADALPDANLGILYATETFANDLPSILTFLRETTRIRTWVGATAPGILCGAAEIRDGGALAVMAGCLPESDVKCFSGLEPQDFARQGPVGGGVALVHGDGRNPALGTLIEAASAAGGFLVGGLVSVAGPPAQVAETVISGGLSGLTLGDGIEMVTGLTQGCSPLGARHEVTESWEGVIMALDGRPALEVLKDEAGELIARDLRRAAGYIHLGLPVPGSDTGDYLVRSLVGVDPRQGWLAIGDRVAKGDQVMFVRRDANAAHADMTRMLGDVTRRVGDRPAQAAIYVSCVGRGRHMFGEDGAEAALIGEALGDVPLIGFFANGEICRDRLYGYSGVLAVLVGDGS